jgi:hypothetical protein
MQAMRLSLRAADAAVGGSVTILEAVKAVPHRKDCAVFLEGWPSLGEADAGPCDCDRDERIAKGIEAAVNESWGHGNLNSASARADAMVIAAFVKATSVL